ncbi:hypothetical protein XELAEV_18014788mg [Xenopus laevis]|uniref:Alkylated DNA repair protein AlkB homologue 8 N-terminal domain-containing protein n=1 Tax=Xenopus laevis TaxID=8355 RepID=A0A974DGV6_XENLA|nr:hypothetical protein XELAEV_18014788mg [Xenopus laevis]
MVEEYKYLGIFIDNSLNWAKNTAVLYRKGMSRLFFHRRLRSFNVCKEIMLMFYGVACLGSRLKVADVNRLNKFIRGTGSVLSLRLETLEMVLEKKMLS